MLALKSALPAYVDISHAEDTTLLHDLRRRSRIALLNLPRLYVYAFHGRNIWSADHFEGQWQRCTTRYTGERYRAVLDELGKRLPIAAYEGLLAPSGEGIGGSRPPLGGDRVEAAIRPSIGFNLYGHMTSPTGIGAAARAIVAGLAAVRLPHTVLDLDEFRREPFTAGIANPPPLAGPQGINIFLSTVDRVERLGSGRNPRVTPACFAGRYNIAYLVWESANSFPAAWRGIFQHFDEVWVPSRFVAESLKPLTSLPIIVIPHALQPRPVVLKRSDLALRPDRFVFLFMFDEMSGFARKNPLGVIEAFKRAFPPDDQRASLFIKARTLSDENLARLKTAAAGSAIDIYVEEIVRKALSSLVAHADAYISLHRSEGFGLTIAEAMQLKRPVVATAYSGNLDFMTPENSYMVPYRLLRLAEADGLYPPGTEWAEPDLDVAAEMMRSIVADPAAARQRGERAAADIAAKFSPRAIGELIEKRLAELRVGGHLNRRPPGTPAVAVRDASMPLPRPAMAPPRPLATPPPNLLVLTPVKDALAYLPRYFELLEHLEYDHARLSLGLLEGDSRDGTYDELVKRLPSLKTRYRRVSVGKHDFGSPSAGPRWRREAQRMRRSVLARARNRLLAEALADEEWVLWLDVDLIDYPASLITDLLAAGKDIIVPHCVRPDGQTFDLNSFRFAPERGPVEDSAHLVDGIYQPPRGHGRRYIGELGGDAPVAIDAVGGTALLIKADLHREGLIFPAYSHRGYIETEGLAMMARDMGHQSWALPRVRIVHPQA